MKDEELTAPAYYARPRLLNSGALRDWWSVLHPPYTLLLLSLVTLGACVSAPVNMVRLGTTLAAFLLAVGIGAHSLDELHGRPLRTSLRDGSLVAAAIIGLGGAVALGVIGMFVVSDWLAIFIVVGVVVAVGYNLELLRGRLHTRTVVVLAWGGFPVVTAYYAQHRTLGLSAILAAGFGALITLAQQQLSTPARELRRRTLAVDGTVHRRDGTTVRIDIESLLAPLESALKTLCRAGPLLALAVLAARLAHH